MVTVKFKNPGKRSERRPSGMPCASKSKLYRAIWLQCIDCFGGENTKENREYIAGCTAPKCPLFNFRPYQDGSYE